MSKVPTTARGAGKPQIKPKDFGGADLLIGTIATVEFREDSFNKGAHKTVLTFTEYEDQELRVGKRGTDILSQVLGEESDEWIGERVPFVKRFEQMSKSSGGDGYVYQVPPAEEWTALLKKGKAKK